ncbi:MAG: hypothetical protein QG657_3298 [Acidobacteriota bacterium]|nr:hypothetical protein [Acidobacteriota bacterium]
MESTYNRMKKFINNYCSDYSQYANDAETMPKMDQYWTPDFKAVAYFRRSSGEYPVVYPSRKDFQEFLIKTHHVIKDSMNPVDFIIDEKEKKVVIRVKIVKTNNQTAEKIEIDGMGCYQLVEAKGGNFMITRLDFMWEAPETIKNLGK